MQWLVERTQWGGPTVDLHPPYPQDSPVAQRIRELALRSALGCLSDRAIGLSLAAEFLPSPANDRDPISVLVRLLSLIEPLERSVLPALRKALRCGTTAQAVWSNEPRSGALQLRSTLTRSWAEGTTYPSVWHVRQVERLADIPINRLILTILLRARRRFADALSATGQYHVPRLGERTLLLSAITSLDRFVRSGPLGSELRESESSVEKLLADCSPFRADLRRIQRVIEWWRRLDELDLAALFERGRNSWCDGLSVSCCYEMTGVLSLLQAIAELLPPLRRSADGEPSCPGVAFLLPSGALRFEVARRPAGFTLGRFPSALLTVLRGGERLEETIVEVRNFSRAGVDELLANLGLRATPRRRAWLVTPDAPTMPKDDSVFGLTLTVDRDDPVKTWLSILKPEIERWASFTG